MPRSKSSKVSLSSAVAWRKLTWPVSEPIVRAQIRVMTVIVQAYTAKKIAKSVPRRPSAQLISPISAMTYPSTTSCMRRSPTMQTKTTPTSMAGV